MYSILMDVNTKTYYMDAREAAFYAFSDISKLDTKRKNSRLIETEIDDRKEFETMLYNAGFFYGHLDGNPCRLSKNSIYYFNRNPNEIVFGQYLLSKDKSYLELIKKQYLITLCKIDGDDIYFPTVTLENGDVAVLAYTDRKRIPAELFEKYDGWRGVRMTFQAKCIVNGSFLISD